MCSFVAQWVVNPNSFRKENSVGLQYLSISPHISVYDQEQVKRHKISAIVALFPKFCRFLKLFKKKKRPTNFYVLSCNFFNIFLFCLFLCRCLFILTSLGISSFIYTFYSLVFATCDLSISPDGGAALTTLVLCAAEN